MTSFSGAFAAQYFGYSYKYGTGTIISGLAALILGEALCPPKSIFRLLLAALIGSVIYRLLFEIGLRMHIHPWNLKSRLTFISYFLIVKHKLSRKAANCLWELRPYDNTGKR